MRFPSIGSPECSTDLSSGARSQSRSNKPSIWELGLTFVYLQVHFANYNDKEDVLRKAKLLKGAGIHISEDFSRKVRGSKDIQTDHASSLPR